MEDLRITVRAAKLGVLQGCARPQSARLGILGHFPAFSKPAIRYFLFSFDQPPLKRTADDGRKRSATELREGSQSSRAGGFTFPHNRLDPAKFPHFTCDSVSISGLFSEKVTCKTAQFLLGVQEVPSSNPGSPTNPFNLKTAVSR